MKKGGKLFIVKIGGNVIDDEKTLDLFLRDFSKVDEPKILVHGGGKIASKIGEQLGIKPEYVNGRRITDRKTIDLVTMVYGGLLNKQLVSTLQSLGCNALGLTGADGNCIPAKKREVKEIDFGYVGDINPKEINSDWITDLLNKGFTLVFAPLTHSEGMILNTNADTIASSLAQALQSDFDIRLIFCFEKKGVLTNQDDENSVIPRLNNSTYKEYLDQGIFSDGIIPKLENAFAVIENGVNEVVIGHPRKLLQNIGEDTDGTLIIKE